MQTIEEILNKIKQLKGVKKDSDLAELLGVKPSTVTTWKDRKTVPYGVLFRFCEKDEIDLVWLVTGRITTKYIDVEGKRVLVMSREPGLYKLQDIPPGSSFSDVSDSCGDFVLIPQIEGRISGGEGFVADNVIEMRIAFRRDWISRKGDPLNMKLVRVRGDSMEPTLLEGDLLLVDLNRNYIEPPGGIYALYINDRIIAKRVQVISPGGKLRIISDNPNYEPVDADPDQIGVNGKVIWYARELER